jgi:hypothetical protein
MIQRSSVQVDHGRTDESISGIVLRVNCYFCGCPGEVIVDRVDEIEWRERT